MTNEELVTELQRFSRTADILIDTDSGYLKINGIYSTTEIPHRAIFIRAGEENEGLSEK